MASLMFHDPFLYIRLLIPYQTLGSAQDEREIIRIGIDSKAPGYQFSGCQWLLEIVCIERF